MGATIYLDVDGVINAISSGAPRPTTHWMGQWRKETIAHFPIHWSQELIEELNAIAALPDVSVKWLTSWEGAAHELAASVGLVGGHEWEVIPGVEDDNPATWDWWKLAKIREDIAATRPDKVVWIDDDISSDPKTVTWLMSPGVDILPICPQTLHGLTRKHIRQIHEFLDTPGDSN